MSMMNNGFRLLSASTIVLVSAFTMPGVAHAQLLFDWGGGTQKVNDTGRQSVRINSDAKPGEIIVSFTDRKLYLITAPGRAISYPVAIPREQDRWEGKTTVTQKRENPSWTPTPSMIKENPRLPRWVPGGHPMNPLGNRALYLGSSFYRIHGTDAPWTIGTAVSKGCIRMYNKDALDVYDQSKVGAKVLVTWNSYKTTADGEAPQAAAADAPEGSPAGSRASFGGTSRRSADIPARSAPAATAVAAPAAAAAAASSSSQKRSESRYSDIFGTPEPSAPAAASRPVGETEPARASRPARERENQAHREPRKSRDATAERARAEPAATPKASTSAAAGGSDAVTAKPKAAEPRQRAPAAVETGALPERRAKPKAAAPEKAASPEPAVAPVQTQAAIPPPVAQPDAAARALEAAERAAAAAERAAAAAERAEKAMATRAAAAAAASVAAAPPPAPAAAPAAPAPANGGGD